MGCPALYRCDHVIIKEAAEPHLTCFRSNGSLYSLAVITNMHHKLLADLPLLMITHCNSSQLAMIATNLKKNVLPSFIGPFAAIQVAELCLLSHVAPITSPGLSTPTWSLTTKLK